ncbi:hypothetical protein BH09PAT3_BH09PAT3_1070 [soil metagenome]
MGRVFTSEELATCRLPGPNNFAAAAQFLLTAVEASEDIAQYQPQTAGALVFGSTTTETTTVRSDLDVLIAYHDDGYPRSTTLLAYREIFKNIKDIFDVTVESTIESTADLQSGNHTIDNLFLPNLLSVPSTWSTRLNPAQITQVPCRPAMDIFRDYSIAKDRKFGKALTDSSDIDTKNMQRALELPVALGRKALGALAECEPLELQAEITPNMPKRAVVDCLALIKSPQNAVTPLEKLLVLDQEYTDLVEAAAARQTHAVEHERWLRAHYVSALALAIDYNDSLSRHVLAVTAGAKN